MFIRIINSNPVMLSIMRIMWASEFIPMPRYQEVAESEQAENIV